MLDDFNNPDQGQDWLGGGGNAMRSASPSFELNCPGKYWTGDNMGRPPRYDDPVKMEEAIEEYFDSLTDDSGEFDKVPTMAGLTRSIGFMDRSALDEYQKREGFSHIVKDAKNRIQEYWERRLAGNACTGAIFWLKNHAGYRDSHEVTGKDGGSLSVQIEYVNKAQ